MINVGENNFIVAFLSVAKYNKTTRVLSLLFREDNKMKRSGPKIAVFFIMSTILSSQCGKGDVMVTTATR